PGREAEQVAVEGGAAVGDGGAAHPPGGRRQLAGLNPRDRRRSEQPETPMKDLVLFLAKQLVNHPDAVEVKETQGDTASVLELKVAREDIGRVIGKQGRTAKSIRTILNAVASRTNRKVVLEIIEDR